MTKIQPMPRRSAAKQATIGRKLNAQRVIAPHVINATVTLAKGSEKQVIRASRKQGFKRGLARVYAGESFFLVASKVDPSRYYVIDARGVCSSEDTQTIARCSSLVALYQIQHMKQAA